MIEVSKDQIAEVIKRLQSLDYYFHRSVDARENFQKNNSTFNGRTVKLSIADSGLYQLELDNGSICLYDAKAILEPIKQIGSIDNIVSMARIINPDTLQPQDLLFCKEYGKFIVFLFKQTIALNFFGALFPRERDNLVEYLKLLVPISNEIRYDYEKY